MPAIKAFNQALSKKELSIMERLRSPADIQSFLDQIKYSIEEIYRSPLRVLRDGSGHCFDGALFAAAALRRIGRPPLILEMISNGRDDSHLLALYKTGGYWGAVAKSNCVGLRFREPVYRTLRELVLSYFEQYFNIHGEKTLRGYTMPLDLKSFDKLNWMTEDKAADLISGRLDESRRFDIITKGMGSRLSPVDQRSFKSGLLGSRKAGLFKPQKKLF